MTDLHLALRPIRETVFPDYFSQLSVAIRDVYKRLKVLSDGEGVLPKTIEVG